MSARCLSRRSSTSSTTGIALARNIWWGGPRIVSTPASRKTEKDGPCALYALLPGPLPKPTRLANPPVYYQDDLEIGNQVVSPITGRTHTHNLPLAALQAQLLKHLPL